MVYNVGWAQERIFESLVEISWSIALELVREIG